MEPSKTTEAPQESPRRGWRSRVCTLVAVGSFFYLAVVLALGGLLYAGDLWWPATLLMFSPRWLLTLPLALLLPAAALLRRRSLVPLLAAFVLAFPVTGFRIPWRSPWSRAPDGTRLRLLTCNMHYRSPDPAAFDQLLAEAAPDVVAVQEWPGWQRSRVLADGWHVRRTPGLFLASRFPIRLATDLGRDSMGGKGSVMRYELETPAGLVTLFSLHLASPRDGLSEVIRDNDRGATELQAGSELRWEQSANVARAAAAVSGPLLLVGDFNTPPESAIFRRTWARYTDAFTAAGWGWGYTFLGKKVAVRIDHILAGPGWHCDRCWVGPNVGSPHRPVLADLTWPSTPGEQAADARRYITGRQGTPMRPNWFPQCPAC